jgi:choline dehydrogenase-like flavoprotein
MRVDCDVLIVGSGAAGGVLAATLSELTNLRILLVERGGHFTRTFFNQREWDMGVLYAERGARSTEDGAIPVRGGECVGGGTTVNIALCFDPVPAVWNRWRQTRGLTGFSFEPDAADYGIAGLNMTSSLADVRRRINVREVAEADVNDNNRVLERGCRVLGIPTRRFELNMRACVGCGFCAEGCAYDAKQGTLVTYVPDALSRGVRLIHHCDVEELTFERRQGALTAVGARARVRQTRRGSQPNGAPPGDLEIAARMVVVSAGAIASPSLLQRSRHPDPHQLLGRGLILHPSLPVVGIMDAPLVNYRGISGSIYCDHFAATDGYYLECLFGHPVYGSTILPAIGAEHFGLMRRYRSIAGFGVMLVDTVDAANRVEWHPASGRARIHYQLGDDDKRRLRNAARQSVEVMFAGGAREVWLPSEERIGSLDAPRFTRADQARLCDELRFPPFQTVVTSAHCQATVKMGEDPATAAVNSRGESPHVRNLVVCDSSVFPESCGVNPMISIMAMARYQARRIAGELARYDL